MRKPGILQFFSIPAYICVHSHQKGLQAPQNIQVFFLTLSELLSVRRRTGSSSSPEPWSPYPDNSERLHNTAKLGRQKALIHPCELCRRCGEGMSWNDDSWTFLTGSYVTERGRVSVVRYVFCVLRRKQLDPQVLNSKLYSWYHQEPFPSRVNAVLLAEWPQE